MSGNDKEESSLTIYESIILVVIAIPLVVNTWKWWAAFEWTWWTK